MEKDVFCKIIEGEIESEFLFETEELVVLKDIAPKAPVHYLVVPRKHIETINDAKEEDTELLGKMILTAQKAVQELKIDEGYKLVFNVGKNGGQEVPHIHLHILGGWNN